MDYETWFRKYEASLNSSYQERIAPRSTNNGDNMEWFEDYCIEMYEDYKGVLQEREDCLID